MLKPTKRLTRKQIKQDKFVTIYFKVVDYINLNSKLVTGIALGIAAVVIISILFMRSKRTAEMNASVELTKARVELAGYNAETAIDILKNMADNYSGTKSAGRGVFYLANIYFEQNKYDEALTYYNKYLDDYSDDVILASSSFSGIGACFEQKEAYLEAAQYYKKGADKYDKHFEAPEQLMSAARCFKLANNKTEALKMYQTIIDKYPESKVKKDAEFFLSELQG